MGKKMFVLSLSLALTLFCHASEFDSKKLDADVTTLAGIMQTAASDQNHGQQPSVGVYLETFGLMMNMSLYNYRSGNWVAFADKNNQEFMRVLEVYLPTIRQLKEKDQIVMMINSQGGRQKTTTVQLSYKDLLDLGKKKISREEFAERIHIGENLSTAGAAALDSTKLRMDARLVGTLLRQIVNPDRSSSGQMDQPFYVKGHGLVIFTYVYPERSDAPLFSKADEEFRRLVTQFLPNIRQLKASDRIVIAVKTPHSRPVKQAIISVKKRDLIAFQEGKIPVEELMEKVALDENSSYVRK